MKFFTKYYGLYRLNSDYSLLFNTLTGAKDIIDEPTRTVIDRLIAGNTDCDCPADLREQLEKRGYLFESEEKEHELLEKMHERTKEINAQSTTPNYTICPTMGCNLRCTYCFESTELHEECAVMTMEQLEGILSMVKESILQNKERMEKMAEEAKKAREQQSSKGEACEKQGCEGEACEKPDGEDEMCEECKGQHNYVGHLDLFGGEPLLPINRKIVERIYEFANEWNCSVSAITNGTNISAYADLLKANAEKTLLQITLDGDKEIHDTRRIRADGSGTFDKVCEGVTEALKLGVQVSLRVNVDKDNLYSLPRLKELFDEQHWTEYPNFGPYLSPVECYEESGDHDTVTDADILEYVYEKGLYGTEHPVFHNAGPTTGMIEAFFRNEMWKTTYCGATLGLNYLFTPNGNVYPCLTFCGNDKYVVGTYQGDKVTMNEQHNVWKNRDPFEMKNCKDCKYLLLCSGGCPARPNADAEECLIRPTYDRIIELFVAHNSDAYLKTLERHNNQQNEKKEESKA